METRARYVVVGAFVLALIAGAFGIVIYLSRASLEEAPSRYMVYFTGSVTGLQLGSPVRYRGVPVGTVADIRLDPDNVERIRVIAEMFPGTPIKQDTIATLGLQGVTGTAYVQLIGGTQASPDLKPSSAGNLPVIQSRASGLEQVLAKAPELLERAVAISERLALVLDDRNLGAVTASLENIRALTGTLAGRSAEIDRIIADGQKTVTALRTTAQDVGVLTRELSGKITPIAGTAEDVMTDAQVTLADARQAIASFGKIANELNGVIGENRAPIRDFSSGGLYELSQFIAEARVLVAALTRLSTQIERDPARFFFGDTQKGFETK